MLEQESGHPVKALVHYYARAANPALAHVLGFKDADAWLRFPTAEDGSFRVVGLPGPGLVGAIAMEPDRYQPTEHVGQLAARALMDTYPGPIHLPGYHVLVEIDPSPDLGQLERDLVVIPSNRLSGTVLDPDGAPLSGAQVAGLDIVGSF